MRRTKLGTDDIVTLDESKPGGSYYSITLDINKQRMYWIEYVDGSEFSSIISSDYNGKDQKNIFIGQKLYLLSVSNDSIFFIKNDEVRMIMITQNKTNVSRSFKIDSSDYYELIAFNNFNHATGKSYIKLSPNFTSMLLLSMFKCIN